LFGVEILKVVPGRVSTEVFFQFKKRLKKSWNHKRQKDYWPFTFWINCSSDLKRFANSRPFSIEFQKFSWIFFLTLGRNNFGNKIPFSPEKYFLSHFSGWRPIKF
jgi:hypothetical protein